MNSLPKISVITVCYNAAKTIEQTLESVLNQTYSFIEYIIIDGASTDGTLSLIEKYRDKISMLVSEKDKGLYDAMNKGLQQATGDYVFFLNADDLFYDNGVLEKLAEAANNHNFPDVLYGEAMFMDESGKELGLRSEQTTQRVPEQLHWKSLKHGMVISHQAFLVKRTAAVSFDMRYRLCADIDWMIRCLKKAQSCFNTHLIISKFRMGGLSKQQQKRSWKERYLILGRHYGHVGNAFRHLYIAWRFLQKRKA